MGRGKLYYGWVIVVVAFFSMAFWMGIRSSFSVFYAHLVDEMGWSRAQAVLAQSLGFVMYMVSVPFIGGFIDRFGPRKVILPGVLLTGLGLMFCASIRGLFSLYTFYGVMVGLGISFISIVSYSSVLAHWFDKKRGLASGIASSGMGVGTYLLVRLSEQLISNFGWRWAFWGLGVLTLLVLLPVNGFFLKHKPIEVGSGPYRVTGQEASVINGKQSKKVLSLLLTRSFVMCVLFASFALLAIHIVLVHNVRILMDRGIPMVKAASAFAMVGLLSSGFRVFWGWLSDKIGRKLAYTFGSFFLLVSTLFLFTVTPQREFLLHLFVWTFSAGWAVTAPSFMAVLADLFKGERFGMIYGFFESFMYALSIVGVWLVGMIYDLTKTYWPHVFMILTLSIFLSTLLIWFVNKGSQTLHRMV